MFLRCLSLVPGAFAWPERLHKTRVPSGSVTRSPEAHHMAWPLCGVRFLVRAGNAPMSSARAWIINRWCKEPKCLHRCYDARRVKWTLCAVNPTEPGQKPSVQQGSTLHTGMWDLSLNPSHIPRSWQPLKSSPYTLDLSLSLCFPCPFSLSFHQSWQWNCKLHSALINSLQKKTTKLVNWHTLSTLCRFFPRQSNAHTPCQRVSGSDGASGGSSTHSWLERSHLFWGFFKESENSSFSRLMPPTHYTSP